MRRSVLEKLSLKELQARARRFNVPIAGCSKRHLVDTFCSIQEHKIKEMQEILESGGDENDLGVKGLRYFARELIGVKVEFWEYEYGLAFESLFRYEGTPEEIEAEFDRLEPEVDRFNAYVDGGKINFGREIRGRDLLPMLKAVSDKPWNRWTKTDINLIRETLEGVVVIDFKASIDRETNIPYENFRDQLDEFLNENIALRAALDPHVVIVDVFQQNFDVDQMNQEINTMKFPEFIKERMPVKTNPSETSFVWSFETYDAASYFVEHLKRTVPNIRLLYVQSDHPVRLY